MCVDAATGGSPRSTAGDISVGAETPVSVGRGRRSRSCITAGRDGAARSVACRPAVRRPVKVGGDRGSLSRRDHGLRARETGRAARGRRLRGAAPRRRAGDASRTVRARVRATRSASKSARNGSRFNDGPGGVVLTSVRLCGATSGDGSPTASCRNRSGTYGSRSALGGPRP